MIDNFFLSRRQGYIKAINNPILFLEMIKPTRSNIKWDALESDAKFTAKGDNGVRPIPEKWWAILPFNSWFHIYEKMGTGNLVQRELQERNGIRNSSLDNPTSCRFSRIQGGELRPADVNQCSRIILSPGISRVGRLFSSPSSRRPARSHTKRCKPAAGMHDLLPFWLSRSARLTNPTDSCSQSAYRAN